MKKLSFKDKAIIVLTITSLLPISVVLRFAIIASLVSLQVLFLSIDVYLSNREIYIVRKRREKKKSEHLRVVEDIRKAM